MKKIVGLTLSLWLLLVAPSQAAVNSKEQNFAQLLSAGALSATTTFAITDAGFLSVVSLHFSSAPASAETIKVYRKSRAGANFDTLLASYTTTAGSTTDVAFLVGNVVPIAETDQVKVTCTNVSAATTVYLSVVLDTAPRGTTGVSIYDNGLLKISGRDHDYHWHFGDVIPDANQSFGAYYSDFASLAAPASPAAGTRRLFVDSGTNELSVRTSAGTTVSLEGASGGGDSVKINTVASTDPDYNDTTPAAPGTGVNVFWQKDTTAPDNVSAYVKMATASIPGVVSTAAQTFAGSKTLTDTLVLDNQKDVRWSEGTAGGTNYVSFAAPATLASNRTCVFQDGAAPIPDSCVGDGVDNTIAGGVPANSTEVTASFSDSGEGSVETVVTGETWVTATTEITCTATGFATADRADGDEDALLEGIQAIAHTRIVGTGYTVETKAREGNAHGDYIMHCIGV